MTSHRTGSSGAFAADLKFTGQQMLQTFVVHHQHHQIHAFCADLKSPATAAYRYEGRSAPPGGGSAAGNATAVLSADNEAGFNQVGHYHDALRIVQHLFRYALVGRAHDFLKNV